MSLSSSKRVLSGHGFIGIHARIAAGDAAALVPFPRANLVRFYGIVGPAAKCRPVVVPASDADSRSSQFAWTFFGERDVG